MSKQPLISIIIIVYNRVAEIEKTLESVFWQSYGNTELVIIDGGSTDGTHEIVQKYRSKINYYHSEADAGIYDAMNKGIKRAKGDWIYFLGAGDILYPVLEDLVQALTDKNTIYYGDVFHNDIKRRYDGKFNAFKLAVNNFCHQAVFYPAVVFKKYQFNTRYKVLADHDLNMRCYGDKSLYFKYLPILICEYQGGGISSSGMDPAFYEDKLHVVRKNFSYPVFVYVYSRRTAARLLKKLRTWIG